MERRAELVAEILIYNYYLDRLFEGSWFNSSSPPGDKNSVLEEAGVREVQSLSLPVCELRSI